MADNTTKNIEDIQIGDSVLALSIDGMPDEFNPVQSYYSWSVEVDDLSYTQSVSTVFGAAEKVHPGGYYVISLDDNSMLNVTVDHPLLVLRSGVVLWKDVNELVIGDKLLGANTQWITITDITINTGTHLVYRINVEDDDVYFAGGILAHNCLI